MKTHTIKKIKPAYIYFTALLLAPFHSPDTNHAIFPHILANVCVVAQPTKAFSLPIKLKPIP